MNGIWRGGHPERSEGSRAFSHRSVQ